MDRPLSGESWANAAHNLSSLCAADARIIRFDKTVSQGGLFEVFTPEFATDTDHIEIPGPNDALGLNPQP